MLISSVTMRLENRRAGMNTSSTSIIEGGGLIAKERDFKLRS